MKKAKEYLFKTHFHLEGNQYGIVHYEGAINSVEDMYKAVEIAYREGYERGVGGLAFELDQEDYISTIEDFWERLSKNQKDLDPEYQKVLDENYWDLLTAKGDEKS